MTDMKGFIPKEGIARIEIGEGTIPVYLPDRTEIGRAKLYKDDQGNILAEVKLPPGPYPELIHDELVGLSIVYQSVEARDAVADANLLEKTQAENSEGEE